MIVCYRPDMTCSFPRGPTWRWDGEVAAGRRRALCCCGAGLRSRPERWEEWAVGPGEGRRCRGGRLEAERRRDVEGPRRSQGEILGLDGEGRQTGRCSVRSLYSHASRKRPLALPLPQKQPKPASRSISFHRITLCVSWCIKRSWFQSES